MSFTMSKQEYNAWRAAHPGKNQYHIFHKEDGRDVCDFEFWAPSREAAFEELELFKQKQALVAPAKEREYFYKEVNNHVVVHENGTYSVGCSLFEDLVGRKESVWEKVKTFFSRMAWKVRDVKYMLYDVAFWLGHYDMRTNHGEERADYWSLEGTVLRKILFNVPRLIANMHGCPSVYAVDAVIAARSKPDAPMTREQAYRVSASDAEMDAAMAAWKADLEKLLLYVRLFQYYSEHGIVDDRDKAMAEIDREYKSTIPTMPGTAGELDYEGLDKLAEKYWNLYCDHWKKIGRMCWD